MAPEVLWEFKLLLALLLLRFNPKIGCPKTEKERPDTMASKIKMELIPQSYICLFICDADLT